MISTSTFPYAFKKLCHIWHLVLAVLEQVFQNSSDQFIKQASEVSHKLQVLYKRRKNNIDNVNEMDKKEEILPDEMI